MTGQPKKARIEQTGQDGPDWTRGTGQPREDSRDRTARTWKHGPTARTGQKGRDIRGLPEDSQTGLSKIKQ
jgi:hypothetical protein